jgi:hypothetical protein
MTGLLAAAGLLVVVLLLTAGAVFEYARPAGHHTTREELRVEREAIAWFRHQLQLADRENDRLNRALAAEHERRRVEAEADLRAARERRTITAAAKP